ncbi:hypothetical protein [Bradyrhizobium australafricanum]|uniref:hypothetical protein n=1 Tax=Bradyrhizobium australafricanum TaxID=2821406 RepID=UPI001CE2898C|nr:hypothetical protein [Bradyrhizobium australafricanum]MCA6101028.1 hypothetical protein [Bradyrhizobium australafricanum]
MLFLQKSKSSFETVCNIVPVLHLMSASASWTMGLLLRLQELKTSTASMRRVPLQIAMLGGYLTRTRDHPPRNIT